MKTRNKKKKMLFKWTVEIKRIKRYVYMLYAIMRVATTPSVYINILAFDIKAMSRASFDII